MSEATERAQALRQELAAAEATVKAERAAERQAARDAHRAEVIAKTVAYRDDNLSGFAGEHSNYVGVRGDYRGGVELEITEWDSVQSSVSLSRDETLTLIAILQEQVK